MPLYYEHDQLMHIVKSPVPRVLNIRSAILNAGFRCSIAHCNPRALKTDAPMSLLWDIARTVVSINSGFYYLLACYGGSACKPRCMEAYGTITYVSIGIWYVKLIFSLFNRKKKRHSNLSTGDDCESCNLLNAQETF